MDLKQRISTMCAMTLPLLALGAYFMVSPVKVKADDGDCPGATVYSPAGGGWCETGTGGVLAPGTTNPGYVFCSDGMGGIYGPGSCPTDDSSCVSCVYGPA